MQVYLHFGQKRGKSSNTVCGRICVLVLLPHLGQQSQPALTFSFSVMKKVTSLYRKPAPQKQRRGQSCRRQSRESP